MANNTPKGSKDIEELESAFKKIANKRNTAKSGRYAKARDNRVTTILIICISIFLILAVVGTILLFNLSAKNKTISYDISIMGINLNGMSTKDAAQALDKKFSKEYTDISVQITIEGIAVDISSAELGAKLDSNRIIDDVLSGAYSEDDFIGKYMTLEDNVIEKKILSSIPPIEEPLVPNTYSIEGAKPEAFDKVDENVSMVLIVKKGSPGKNLSIPEIVKLLKKSIWDKTHTLSYDCPVTTPDAPNFEEISKQFCTLPVDATYDTETFKISGGTLGYLFDIQEAARALEAAAYGETVSIPFKWVEPSHTLEELNEVLFKDELATYTTKAGWDANRNVNLRLACEAIDGIIMNPGDSFSYNDTLGQRTPEKGYRPGASYVGGETVYDYGGGICQVSSTLYYCTIVCDLEIVERECHGYASSYIPLSMDATVFWGGIDFKFKNNSLYPIKINAHAEGGNVTVSITGTDYKDYYVKFEYEHLATIPYEIIYEEMTADNEKGLKDGDVITGAYTGYKSKGYRAKYSKATDELIERILESTDVYAKRDRVICKIVEDEPEPTDPTEPTPTDPTPSEPTDTPTDPPTEAPTDAPTDAPTPAPTDPVPSAEAAA